MMVRCIALAALIGCSDDTVFGAPPTDPIIWLEMDGDPANGVAPDRAGPHDAVCARGFSCPTLDLGRLGGAYRFDGRNDFLLVRDVRLGSAYTIAAFVRLTVFGAEGVALAKPLGPGTLDTWRIGAGQEYNLYLGTSNGFVNEVSYGEPHTLSDQFWTHVAATYDGTTQRFYLDGVQSTEHETQIAIETGDMLVGIDRDDTAYTVPWPGLIDDLRLYARALTGDEVFALSIQ